MSTVPANITVESYTGLFYVKALSKDNDVLGNDVFSATPSSPSVTLEVTVTQGGAYPVTFKVFNNVSLVSVTADVMVAGLLMGSVCVCVCDAVAYRS